MKRAKLPKTLWLQAQWARISGTKSFEEKNLWAALPSMVCCSVKACFAVVLCLSVLCSTPVSLALADDAPGWIDRAQKEAEAEGYGLLDHEAFDRVVGEIHVSGGGSDILLLDVRPDYEFADGHVPGAMNFEFDLGDRMGMSAEKEQAFRKLAGDNLKRRLVLYCRSPQCVRSAIAATRIVRLGYTNVARYPWGWNGWRDRHRQPEEDGCEGASFEGTLFPEVHLQFAGGPEDRTALGLPPDASCAWLHAVPGRYLLVMLFNSLCSNCVQEAEAYEQWRERELSGDMTGDVVDGGPGEVTDELSDELPDTSREEGAVVSAKSGQHTLPIIGLGIFDSRAKVVAFRQEHNIGFPLFPNRKGEVFEEMGDGELPKGYLLERTGRGWVVRLVRQPGGGPQEFLEQVRSVVVYGAGLRDAVGRDTGSDGE